MSREKKQNISLKILKITGTGVLLVAVSILAPTFPYVLLRAYLKKKFGENYTQTQLRSSANYLKRKKFIAFKNRRFILTKLGKKYLKKNKLREIEIRKIPWDQKWRLVTFDVPEQQSAARHVLRKKLNDLGFFHFQRSVFIIPYPCEKEIDLLARELKVNRDVHVFVTNRFENDREILKKFGL